MSYRIYLLMVALVVLLAVLGSCGGEPPTPAVAQQQSAAQGESALKLTETSHGTAATTDTIDANSCGAPGSVQETKKIQTFKVDIGGDIGLEGDILAAKAKVTAKYAQSSQTSVEYRFVPSPGKHQKVTLTWTWEEWKGNLSTGSGVGTFVASLPIKYDQVVEEIPCPVMDVSGVWLTPYKDLSYFITQAKDDTKARWIIRENGINGTGTVEGRTLVVDVEAKKVAYEVALWDSNNPRVLHTTHQDYWHVILFRECGDFQKYVANLKDMFSPQVQGQIDNLLKTVTNPTCP